MLYIPVDYLKPGMVLSKNLYFEIGVLPLLTSGQTLTAAHIKKIRQKAIPGLYVESDGSRDIVIDDCISEETRNKALIGIKNLFDDYSESHSRTVANLTEVASLAGELVDGVFRSDNILINLIDLKSHDDYTYKHSLRVALLSISIGMKLQLTSDQLNEIALSALLHDVGKTMISSEILNKPAKLTRSEFDIMKTHPAVGADTLRKRHAFSGGILMGVESHHERFDGTGYPKGLHGDKIPLYGKILAVADVYDALTSNRPYRRANFPSEAIEYMMACADTHFDMEVLSAFLKIVSVYPSGTIVDLSNGQTAVVVENHIENILRPTVRLLNAPEDITRDIDLLNDSRYMNVTIVGMGYSEEDVNSAAGINT